MAKASWVNVTPASGSGDATVNVSSAQHTGRNARTTTLTWKAANVTNVVRTVAQAGKPEYVNIDDAASADAVGAKVVTISGVSNSKKLTFSLGAGELNVLLPITYIANSLTTTNGADISGDPGATAEYTFSISINVPENETTSPINRQIIVTDEAGHKDVCLLTLAAGLPFIKIAETTIELDYLGTPVSVFVDSNTNWTIE